MLGIKYLNLMTRKQQVFFLRNLTSPYSRDGRVGVSISDYLNKEFTTFHNFIDNAFTWDHTPEGHPYWHTIAFTNV